MSRPRAGSIFTGFSQPTAAAVQVGRRSLATFSRCTFSNNKAAAPNTAAAYGPALGLLAGTEVGTYSGVWLQGCEFVDNETPLRGDVAAADDLCRVFSSESQSPEVYVVSLGQVQGPWVLAEQPIVRLAPGRPSGFRALDFLDPRGPWPQLTLMVRATCHFCKSVTSHRGNLCHASNRCCHIQHAKPTCRGAQPKKLCQK
jgi:hypothetical protein